MGLNDKNSMPPNADTAGKKSPASTSAAAQEKNSSKLFFNAVLVLSSLLIYANSLGCGFVFDDRLAVTENKVE